MKVGSVDPVDSPQASGDPSSAGPNLTSDHGAPQMSRGPTQLATELVMANDAGQSMQKFDAALVDIRNDVLQGKDTTDDSIAAAKAFNDAYDQSNRAAPSYDQQGRIASLAKAIRDGEPTDSLDSIAQKAHVPLPGLQRKSSQDLYGSYGKTASTYTRALIFDEARFNNSKVLQNTSFARLLRPGKSVLDPIGANGRLGVLLGTRMNAAASNFTKAATMFASGIARMRNGQDPTDDFIGGSAAAGQGATEITAGAMTDFGNHMVKLQAARPPQKPATPQSPLSDRTATTSAGRSGSPDEFGQFAPDDPLHERIDSETGSTASDMDQQVAARRHELEERVLNDVEARGDDAAALSLQDGVDGIKGEWLQIGELESTLRDASQQAAKDAHENIKSIDERAQPLVDELKSHGYDTVDAARASDQTAVKRIVAQLDDYAHLKRQAYDQFNHALDEQEGLLKSAPAAFDDLDSLMRSTPVDQRPARVSEWADKYGKAFGKYQNGLLARTDTLPEWFRISKPLRAQLVPSAINTAFGAAGFGAALDNYLKKKNAGTLTTPDKLNLGAQVVNLAGGIIGFIPTAGPLLALALASIGVGLGDFADHFKEWQDAEAAEQLKQNLRAEYERRHPGHGIFDGFDGG